MVALTAFLGLGAAGAISKDALLSKAACFGYVRRRMCVPAGGRAGESS
jgi:hypothetical protein